MFPVYVKVKNPEQLKAVYELLGDGDTDAPDVKTTTTAAKPRKAPAASTPAPSTATTAPAAPVLSASAQKYLQDHLSAPVMELSMKDEPKMKAICAEYGVERVSLIPEALFPEVLEKVKNALDPAAAERKRLEGIDKSRSLI